MPTTWTIKRASDGLEQSLADWGLRALNFARYSQAPDILTAQATVAAADATALFAYDEQIWLYRTEDSKVCWFTGKSVPTDRQAAGTSESIAYEFRGPWFDLDRIVYQQDWHISTSPPTIITGKKSKCLLFSDSDGAKLDTKQQITDALNYAIAAGANLAVGTIDPEIDVPTDEVRDPMVSEVLRKALRWAPDAVTWFDYTTATPTLHIRQRANLTAATYDITAGTVATGLGIHARNDLVPPSVVIHFEHTGTNDGISYEQITTDAYPPASTGAEIGAIVLTINLRGASTTYTHQPVETDTINAAAGTTNNDATRIAWWKTKLPWLNDTNITVSSITNVAGLDAELPRELVSGSITDWMETAGVEQDTLQITADIHYTYNNTPYYDSASPAHEAVTLVATDATTKTYSTLTSFDAGEAAPTGLALSFYTALATLHYEGQFTITETECTGATRAGMVLNLTGSTQTAWATMRAFITQSTEDIDAGTTTLVFGPPPHLTPGDLIELLRVTRGRGIGSLVIKRDGKTSGPSVTLGKTTPKENSTSGPKDRVKTAWAYEPGAPAAARTITVDAQEGRLSIVQGAISITADIDLGSLVLTNGTETINIDLDDIPSGLTAQFRELQVCDGSPSIVRYIKVLATEVFDL